MRLALTILCACLLAGACRQDGVERDAVVERAWLDDAEGTLTAEAALARRWTPFSGMLARGYTSSSTWLRLRIDPAAAGPGSLASDHRLVLRIMPEHLDEVAVFRADRLQEPPVLVGDTHTVATPPQALMTHVAQFDDVTEPFLVLLRLRTQSNHSIAVDAVRWDDALIADSSRRDVVVGNLVFMLVLLAVGAAVWLQSREAVFGLFVAHEATMVLATLTLLGVLRLHGPVWLLPALDRLTSLAVPLNAAVTFRFHAQLLADLGASSASLRPLRAALFAVSLALLLVAAGAVRPGLMLTQATIPLAMSSCVVVAARIRPRSTMTGPPDGGWWRGYVTAAYAIMALITMPQSLRALGMVSAQRWSLLGFVGYGVVGSLLVISLLAYRARAMNLLRLRTQQQLAEAQREADSQRARAAEQSELLTMLTHELKTPLSVVSLAVGDAEASATLRERARRAVSNMGAIVDRCAQTAFFDDEFARHDAPPVLAPVHVGEVLAATVDAQGHAERVDRHVARGLPPCRADRQMVLVIVGNLVENALKYSPDHGRVRVSVKPAALEGRPGVSLRIANAVGPAGRPDVAHAFEKYHRGARARAVSGSGLGLYLSHRLAARLGGSLSLRDADSDRPDGDVEFELWLPC